MPRPMISEYATIKPGAGYYLLPEGALMAASDEYWPEPAPDAPKWLPIEPGFVGKPRPYRVAVRRKKRPDRRYA